MAEISRWEYRLETFGTFWSRVKDEEIQATLDQWGEEGWEVIVMYLTSNGESDICRQAPADQRYPPPARLAGQLNRL